MGCDPVHLGIPPTFGVLKLNVNVALKGKLGLAEIGGVLSNTKGKILLIFCKYVGVCDSNQAEVFIYF